MREPRTAPTAAAPENFRFSTEALRPSDRLAFYREMVGRTMGACTIELQDGDNFCLDCSGAIFPNLSILRIAGTAVKINRARAAASAGHDMTLAIVSHGRERFTQFGRELTINERGAVLFSNQDSGCMERTTAAHVYVTVPKAVLAPLTANLDRTMMALIPHDSPAIRLLTGYLDLVARDGGAMPPALRRAAAMHVHDLVALAVGATRDAAEDARGRGVRAARLHALKSDIAERLADPGLTIGAIALRQGISESYIRKLFAAEDTSFSDFVLAQRLRRAHRLLTDPHLKERSITSIAFDAGFGDLSYFNRTFRRQFGVTPSDARRGAAER